MVRCTNEELRKMFWWFRYDTKENSTPVAHVAEGKGTLHRCLVWTGSQAYVSCRCTKQHVSNLRLSKKNKRMCSARWHKQFVYSMQMGINLRTSLQITLCWRYLYILFLLHSLYFCFSSLVTSSSFVRHDFRWFQYIDLLLTFPTKKVKYNGKTVFSWFVTVVY